MSTEERIYIMAGMAVLLIMAIMLLKILFGPLL